MESLENIELTQSKLTTQEAAYPQQMMNHLGHDTRRAWQRKEVTDSEDIEINAIMINNSS